MRENLLDKILRLNKLQQIDYLKTKSCDQEEKQAVKKRMKKRLIKILKAELDLKELELEQSKKNINVLESVLGDVDDYTEESKNGLIIRTFSNGVKYIVNYNLATNSEQLRRIN